MLIDTHAHLTDPRLNADGILADMEQDGLARIITVGYNKESSLGGFAIAQKDKRIFCTLGFHPSNTTEVLLGDYAAFLKLSGNEKVVGIGEIGLDYHYEDTDQQTQKRELLAQLELVHAADLPVVIHLREADEDMFRIVKDNLDKLPRRGVMHCFSGSLESALAYVKMGFYISFSGSITFKNAKKFPEIIKNLPLDRILIETDCPYLAPDPLRGQLNYPKYVKYQAAKIAEFRGITAEEVESITYRNAFNLFTKLV